MSIIRKAVAADAPRLAALHAACFAEAWDAAAFLRLIEGGAFGFVARHAAETDVQSFILVRAAAGESEILSIATAETARRSGLAQSLLHAAATEARAEGAIEMFLEVASDNISALALYRRAGFAACGRRASYYSRPHGAVDALVLRAPLPL